MIKAGDFVRLDDKVDFDYTPDRNEIIARLTGHVFQVDYVDPYLVSFVVTDYYSRKVILGVDKNKVTPI